MELILKAPKAILRVETSSELAIESVIDYVLPPPVSEEALEVMLGKMVGSRFATHHFRLVGNSKHKIGGDHRAVEFEFVGDAYI